MKEIFNKTPRPRKPLIYVEERNKHFQTKKELDAFAITKPIINKQLKGHLYKPCN